ncbi:MAG: TGS domain-containing protein, partial [Candidatus Micrarchaeia archaeon]
SSDLFIYDDSLDPSELEKVKVDKLKVNINVENLDLEIEKIYEKLNLIRVFTKKDKEGGPLTLRRGSTIKDVCEKIHKDLLKNFKYAIVNGKSVKFKNQRVGLEHVVEDGDVITIFAR